MLYTLYLPKRKGDTTNYLVDAINMYSDITGGINDIIASPGYMSTSEKNSEIYLNELGKLVGKRSGSVGIGLLNGMNGSHMQKTVMKTMLQMHKDIIDINCKTGSFYFKNIELNTNLQPDHRKVMVFFKQKRSLDSTGKIVKENIEKFLNSIDVNAVLIGSSNQSKTTYCDIVAKKGEADILMIAVDNVIEYDDKIIEFIASVGIENDYNQEQIRRLYDEYNELLSNCTLSKSVHGKGYYQSREFLKEILRDLLEAGLD